MANRISLKSVSNLLGERFYIPAYQRGYRWEPQQVEELLEDISAFQSNYSTKNEYYCLQPIVVIKHYWNQTENEERLEGWEVVDGQQRLTTILLILHYLEQHKPSGESKSDDNKNRFFAIEYETQRSKPFFLNMGHDAVSDIDSSYMQKAYSAISSWFAKKSNPELFYHYIYDALRLEYKEKENRGVVRVIWYEIEDGNAIETFLRINMGKIPLESAELIKALFLQEKDYGEESDLAKLRQTEISCEWDVIENALHNQELWAFLGGGSQASNRIGLILDIVCENDNFNMCIPPEKLGNDDYRSFRYFYSCIGSVDSYQDIFKIWQSVHDEWNKLIDLFSNHESYHYVGFLVQCGIGIGDIIQSLRVLKSKSDITAKLRAMIADQFPPRIIKKNGDILSIAVDYRKASDRGEIKKLLLLFNIEHIVAQCKDKHSYVRFPFRAYLDGNWDIEHVDSNTENNLSSDKDQREWLKMVVVDFPQIDSDLKNMIDSFLEGKKNSTDFVTLYDKIVLAFGIKSNDEVMKNSIGNLVLLDAGTNRAYRNALFATKRRFIIAKDKVGEFIPICTKNVFLKYFNEASDSQRKWTEQDAEAYCQSIENSIGVFWIAKVRA